MTSRKPPTRAELLKAYNRRVPDLIGPQLRLLFVGINPSLYSAVVGHHFARPGNRFWPTLYGAGFTKRLLYLNIQSFGASPASAMSVCSDTAAAASASGLGYYGQALPSPPGTLIMLRFALAVLWLVAFTAVAAADKPLHHSLFIAGPSFTGILDEDGKEVWDAGKPGARDGFVLASGNVLMAWSDEVKEFTRVEKKVVFEYKKSPDNAEMHRRTLGER